MRFGFLTFSVYHYGVIGVSSGQPSRLIKMFWQRQFTLSAHWRLFRNSLKFWTLSWLVINLVLKRLIINIYNWKWYKVFSYHQKNRLYVYWPSLEYMIFCSSTNLRNDIAHGEFHGQVFLANALRAKIIMVRIQLTSFQIKDKDDLTLKP